MIKKCYNLRKRYLNKSVEFQVKNIEKNSFFTESSCGSVKKLIIEYNMFIKEVIKHFLFFNLNIYIFKKNFYLIYN